MNRRKLKQRICIALSLVMVLLLVLALPVSAASKSKKKPSTATVTSVKSTAYNSATVRWKKAKYATSYRIYYKQFGAKKWIKLKDVNAKTTGYTHKSSKKYPLKAGKRYVYTVRAYNKYGKKWGNYNKNGKVVVIKRKKTVSQPNVVSKPVTSKPTATPVPTKKPQPTAKPKPTATPVPVKPTEAPKPTATPVPATPTVTPAPEDPNDKAEEYAMEVIRYTNIERVKAGEKELKYHAKMQEAAMVRAKEIATLYSHTRPDGRSSGTAMSDAGVGNPGAENILRANKTTPENAVDAWMRSEPHMVTMLASDYTHIGIGYYYDPAQRIECWVQEFSTGPDEMCTLTVDANGGVFPDKNNVEKYTMEVPKGAEIMVSDILIPIKNNSTFNGYLEFYKGIQASEIPVDSLIMTTNKTAKATWTTDKSESGYSQELTFDDESLFADGFNDKNNIDRIFTNNNSTDIDKIANDNFEDDSEMMILDDDESVEVSFDDES